MTTARRLERKYRKAIEALFLKQMPPKLPGSLREHLKVCQACRQLYSSLAFADRQMGESCGIDAVISPFEEELIWKNVSDQLIGQSAAKKRRPGLAPYWLPATALVFSLLLGAFLLWRVKPGNNLDESGFANRGEAAKADLRIHCISSDGESAVAQPEQPGAHTKCRLQQFLGFSFLNPQGQYQGLALFAVDAEGNILPYLPSPSRPEAAPLPGAQVPKALDRTIRLAVNHQVGDYSVVAVFLPYPVNYDQLLRLARALQKDGTVLEAQVVRHVLTVEE